VRSGRERALLMDVGGRSFCCMGGFRGRGEVGSVQLFRSRLVLLSGRCRGTGGGKKVLFVLCLWFSGFRGLWCFREMYRCLSLFSP